MQPYHTLSQWALDVKVHIQMLSTSSILGHCRRNMPIPCPAIPRTLSISSDLLRVAQNVDTPFVLLYAGMCLIEMIRLAIGAENFLVEEPAHAAGCDHADNNDSKVEGLLCTTNHLFAGGEFRPWDTAIIAGEGDGFAGCGRVS